MLDRKPIRKRSTLALTAALLVVLALLLGSIVTAEAQRRGGGFAGGRGFSSPGRSGGFGGGFGGGRGGSFGSSRPRSGGGIGGGFPVFVPIGGFGGGGGAGGIVVLLILGVIVVGVGAAAAGAWYNSRFALVNVGLNLRSGERYSDELERMVKSFDYSTPNGRAEAICSIRDLVNTEDVFDGYVTIPKRMASYDAAGKAAEEVARNQMSYVGVDAETVNIATPEGAGVKVSGRDELPDGEEAAACVLSMLVSLRQKSLKGISKGREPQAVEALEALAMTNPYDLDALYFFYAPQSAEPLDPHAANRIFLDLKAAAAA